MKCKRYTKDELGLLAVLLACSILLCICVHLGLEVKEKKYLEEQFQIIPANQPGTVWADPDTLLYLSVRVDGSTQVTYWLDSIPYEGELVMIHTGYFNLTPKDDPETVVFSGRFYMDDPTTLRLEPGRKGAYEAFLQGRSNLILTGSCLTCKPNSDTK